jgi:hypothetical protein
MSTLNPKVKYEYMPWGEIISGSKEALQRLGIAIGMAFPGEAGAPKRCLRTRDPRGFPVRINKSYWGEDYSACIDLPGRERPEHAPGIAFAPGVVMQERYHCSAYTGTADALVTAGLVLPGQFPGEPGMRKVIVTIFADGTLPSGAPTIRHRRADEPGAKRVQRASKATYQVSVNVSEDESERRREAYFAARDKYEAKMRALPRPTPLSLAGNIVNLQAARTARQHIATDVQGGGLSVPVDTKANAAPKRQQRPAAEVQPAVQLVHSDETFNLTEDEQKIVMDYRRMNKGTREFMLRFCPEIARKDQERLAAESGPKLTLIQGGAQ